MLQTKRLVINRFEIKDLDLYISWVNDYDFFNTYYDSPFNYLTKKKFKDKWDKICNDKNQYKFCIRDKKNLRPLGFVGYEKLNGKNRNAKFYIGIGSKKDWGKGFAKEIMEKFLEYGFHELNIRKIFLTVYKNNPSAISIYKHFGFKEEGILKEHIYKNGNYIDIALMSLFKKDYF